MKINWKVLILSLIIVFAVALLGSLFTSPNTNTEWYQQIKPLITPPSYIFPIVWNILFFLITISLYLSWTSSSKKQKPKLVVVFAINFVLNILWSIIFFGMKNPTLAFAELIIFWLSIIFMITTTYKINKTSSYLLIPYLLWVTFAGVLNYLIAFG
nr:hypothetical protein [uncultured archaeon]